MMVTAIFLVFFVGGPFIFSIMTKVPPTTNALRFLAIVTVFSAVAGLMLRYAVGDTGGMGLWSTGFSVLLIWIAWIGVLAFAVQTLRRNDSSIRMRRWTAIIGALGTTVPWFGLASANLING
ncbi:MAG: hypothetical protein WA790_06660 [Sulfitobacter sp.]